MQKGACLRRENLPADTTDTMREVSATIRLIAIAILGLLWGHPAVRAQVVSPPQTPTSSPATGRVGSGGNIAAASFHQPVAPPAPSVLATSLPPQIQAAGNSIAAADPSNKLAAPAFTIATMPPPAAEPIPLPPATPEPAQAQAAPMLTVDQLEAMAMEHNPTLVEASARVGAMRGNWLQQGLYPNPRIAYKADEMGDEGKTGFQGASLAQELVTHKKLALARNVACQQVRQAEEDYIAQQFRVRNDVKLRFYEVLLAQRAIELSAELERVSQMAADSANDLFKANQVARSDVLQVRVELDTVRLQNVRATNAHQSAWRRLAVAVGIPDMPIQPLGGDVRAGITSISWEQAWQQLAAGSPELTSAQAKVGAVRWAVQKAAADRWPNVDLEVGFSHDNITGDGTTNVMTSVPVPLFNRNQGAIRQAQAELTAAEAEVDRVSLDLRNRLALTFERFANAREVVDRYEQSILPNAKESVDLTASRYSVGDANFTTFLVAQRTYLQTQVTYLEALRELRETSILLDGLLLSDALASGSGR